MSLMTELRGIVLSEHGHDILEVDHSSAEILVLARLIGSPAFSRRVLSGDPYQQLADATGLARNVVKPRLLAFVFDESLRGSAKSVGTEAAALIHEAIRQLFPEIVAWRAEQTERARRGERLTTLWGRPLPVLDGLSYETRPGLAANAQVQGSARDAFGHAVRAADSAGLTLFFPLHDALYVLAPHGTAAESSRLLVEAMTVDLGEGIVLSGKAKNHGGRWGK